MSKVNFLNELNSLNSNLGVNSAIGNKYDYENLDIAKNLRFTFRKQVRKSVENIYNSENVDLKVLQQFANFQENCLLACTKSKKTFIQLKVNEIYPNFEKCTENEKKNLTAKHENFVKLLTPVKK